MYRIPFFFFIMFSFCISSYADVKKISDNKFWTVYQNEDNLKYMLSYPMSEEGNFTKRDKPYLMITNFSGKPEVSAYVGYFYRKGSNVDVVVNMSSKDSSKVERYSLYTKDNMAWCETKECDLAMMNAMRNGSTLVVSAKSTKGTESKDTYSLDGFTSAYKEIMK